MTQRKILVFVLLLSAFAISFAILTFDVLGEEKVPEVYDVSLIVRGKTGEQWESIKQGADQAASEMNVDLSFITLSEENNLPEQISLIQREYDIGVDAIVLAAADSNGLVSTVEQVSENIPVVCIESTVNSAAVKSYISADNYAMGVQLGQEIVRSGNARKRLAVVESSAQCSNVQQRRAGLMSVLGEIGGEVISWTLPDDSSEAARTLAQELRPKSVDVVVTLDVTALEAAAQAVIDEQADYLTLFGIGSTGKVASYIEQDIVNATIVQNDFGIGYLGVKAAVDSLKKRPVAPATVVEHRMINWKNMYDPENRGCSSRLSAEPAPRRGPARRRFSHEHALEKDGAPVVRRALPDAFFRRMQRFGRQPEPRPAADQDRHDRLPAGRHLYLHPQRVFPRDRKGPRVPGQG